MYGKGGGVLCPAKTDPAEGRGAPFKKDWREKYSTYEDDELPFLVLYTYLSSASMVFYWVYVHTCLLTDMFFLK
jgi:hypothetical protein